MSITAEQLCKITRSTKSTRRLRWTVKPAYFLVRWLPESAAIWFIVWAMAHPTWFVAKVNSAAE